MSCYACGRDAIHRCPRCAKPFCDQHGGDLCAACQDPSSAIPSGALFRGALLALLVASVVGLWLLIRPPGDEESGAQAGQPGVTRTPTALATTARPSPTRTGTPGAAATGTPGVSPTPGGTPAATATPTPAPSPTSAPSPFEEYTVQPGDSLSSIATRFGTTADELARINGITDPNTLDVGQKLQVPRPATPSPTPSP